MKRNTPLDYAEFLLTHSRTRCELQICANGVKEKLASGYLKPFVAHLLAAEEQVAKGNQVVRLERPSNFLKKNKVTWFTKGTLERFVRFVSTPDLLERVKNIDDELSQLEHVRVVLSRASPQSDIPFHTNDTINSGVYQRKGGASMKDRRSSVGAGDTGGADASKIELLRAMDVRLIALKQDQSEAFSQAITAGFDSSNMADLLDFSEHFGAVRLREACVQYVDLFRKRNIAQEVSESMEPPSAGAVSSDSDMSLESCMDFEPTAETGQHFGLDVTGEWSKALKNNVPDSAGERNIEVGNDNDNLANIPSSRIRSRWGPPERIQINRLDSEVPDGAIIKKKGEGKHQLGNYSHQEDIRHSNSGFQARGEFLTTVQTIPAASVSSFGGNRWQGMEQGEDDIRGGMFFSRLHKMAQQVEARRSVKDLGVNFTSVERSMESSGSQLSGYKYSSPVYDSVVDSSSNPPLSLVSDGVSVQPQGPENRLPGHTSSNPPLSLVSDGVSVQPQGPENRLVPGHSFSGSIEVKFGSLNSVTNHSVDHAATEDSEKDRTNSLGKSGNATSASSFGKDKQEEPASTSARRLSVQAAINLFESKKVTVGEPPTRKLGRQDSQKGPVQSGSSSSEKSVLRRWSGVGTDGTEIKQDTASETSEKGAEKAESIENAAQKAETFVEDSLRMNKLSESAIDKSSIHARQSATPAVPSVAVSSLPLEVLQKQSKQELVKILTRSSSSNLQMSVNLPSKPGSDSLKTEELTIRKGTVVTGPRNKDVGRASVHKELVDVQEDLGLQKNKNLTEQLLEVVPDSLGIIEVAPKRLPNPKEDNFGSQCIGRQKVNTLNHKPGKSGPDESTIPFETTDEPDKERSLILHGTPVDLYMQALVMMIDNNHQSSQSVGDEESLKEQRGRYYEHYRQLRNARQRTENPAKRAEREAKLKSMQEILERRKAEMEAGVFRHVKNSRLVKEKDGNGQSVQESGLLMRSQEEKEMGEDEVVAQQDRLVFESSYAQIMPRTKIQAARKAAPKLQKTASASRSIMASRTIPKSQTRAGSSVNYQCTVATSSYDRPVDSAVHNNLPLDCGRDVSKFSSVCTEASLNSHGGMNGYCQYVISAVPPLIESNTAATLVDTLSRTANVDFPSQTSDTRQGQAFPSEGDPFYGKTYTESVKGHIKFDQHTAGTAGLKHEDFDYRYSPSCEGKSCPPYSVLDDGVEIVSTGREDDGCFDMRKSFDSSNINNHVKHSAVMHPEKSRSNADKVQSSNQEPLKPLDEELAEYIFEDASNDEKILAINQVDYEKDEENLQKGQMPSGSSEYEKSSGITSAERSFELSQSDSICSPSLLQEFTTSTYHDAAASPMNLFKENSETVLPTNSRKLPISPYSPSGSPVSWISSKTKHLSEHERFSSVPQSTKEPARGFKRFLRFGRKSRNSDSPTTDGISVSTASEGDDETEEVRDAMRQSSNDLFQIAKLQEKTRHLNYNKNHYGFHDQGAANPLQNSIPIPPSNLKAPDDRFLGGTSLKASRSFFSLSSFRSKGGEGKLR